MESSTQLQKRLDNAFSLAPWQRFYNRLAAYLEHRQCRVQRVCPPPPSHLSAPTPSATLLHCWLLPWRAVSTSLCFVAILSALTCFLSLTLRLPTSLPLSFFPLSLLCASPALARLDDISRSVAAERHLRVSLVFVSFAASGDDASDAYHTPQLMLISCWGAKTLAQQSGKKTGKKKTITNVAREVPVRAGVQGVATEIALYNIY